MTLEELSKEEIEFILKMAKSFKEVSSRDIKKVPTLRGKTVVNLFFEPSTRTRTSFELAAKRLSADVLDFSISSSSASKGESPVDTAKNIEAMADAAGASAEAYNRMDMVRGWSRLWQEILRPIAKIGLVMNKELRPSVKDIGDTIATWQASPAFKTFLDQMKVKLKEAQELAGDLFAGGDKRDKPLRK